MRLLLPTLCRPFEYAGDEVDHDYAAVNLGRAMPRAPPRHPKVFVGSEKGSIYTVPQYLATCRSRPERADEPTQAIEADISLIAAQDEWNQDPPLSAHTYATRALKWRSTI